jgi:integrase
MVLVAYRHGLRSVELLTLRWDAVDFAHGRVHVYHVKGGSESVHPLSGRELRALRRLKREQDPALPFIFTSERGAPFTPAGFRKMVARLGIAADLDFPMHPHMLRHPCGFKLANDGVDTRSLQGLFGPPQHPAHSALHRAGADPLQELLARLTGPARLVLTTNISSWNVSRSSCYRGHIISLG